MDRNQKLLLVGFFTGCFGVLFGVFLANESTQILLIGMGAGVMLICFAGMFSNPISRSKYYGIKDVCCTDENIEPFPSLLDENAQCKTCKRVFEIK